MIASRLEEVHIGIKNRFSPSCMAVTGGNPHWNGTADTANRRELRDAGGDPHVHGVAGAPEE